MNTFSRLIAAGGYASVSAPGRVLTVRSSTLPVNVAFDGKDFNEVRSGTVLPGPFRTLLFQNPASVAVTVVFAVGNEAMQFAPADNQQANAQTYLFGNCGVATSGSAALANSSGTTTTVACDADGYLSIPNTPAIVVAGTNNGHRRQVIMFSVSQASSHSLNVQDSSGRAVMTIAAGQQVVLITDSDLQISGAGGTALATVGQIFLSA